MEELTQGNPLRYKFFTIGIKNFFKDFSKTGLLPSDPPIKVKIGSYWLKGLG
jgi:hypothetical protein